jgi:hypothetical protein
MARSTKTSDVSDQAGLSSALLESLELTFDSPADTVLQRAFSNHSVFSATSSFAKTQQQAVEDDILQNFKLIGKGSCGAVFEQTGTGTVAKAALQYNDWLWQDCKIHQKVHQSFQRQLSLTSNIQVPKPLQYIPETHTTWWDQNLPRFPEKYRQPTNLLFSERILPLPQIIRHKLIEKYCPEPFKQNAFTDPENGACLVRLYLGRRRQARRRFGFKLLNFNMFLDMMEDLNLEIEHFATTMADTLAVMHWETQIDARDVEFVLGTAPTALHHSPPSYEELCKMPPNSRTTFEGIGLNFGKREIQMWLLDFNLCDNITMDEAGVDKAVQAFLINDPYYPRPPRQAQESDGEKERAHLQTDAWLWRLFRDRYLATSSKIMEGKAIPKALPELFIERLIAAEGKRVAKKMKILAEEYR